MAYRGNPWPDATPPQVWNNGGFQAPPSTRGVPPPIEPHTIGPGSHARLPQILTAPSSSIGRYTNGTPGAHAGLSPSQPELGGPQAGPCINGTPGAYAGLSQNQTGPGTPDCPYTIDTHSRSHAGLSPSRPELGGPQAGPSTSQTASGLREPSSQTVVSNEAGPSTSQTTEFSQYDIATVKLFTQLVQDHRIEPVDYLRRTIEQKPTNNEKFKCLVKGCHANLTKYDILMGHYARMHRIRDPVRYHAFTMERNIIDLSKDLADSKCVYCGLVASDKKDLEEHITTTHRALRRKNVKTSVPYINTDEVAEACKDELKCEVCSGSFPDKKQLDEHQIKHHGRQAHCIICNKYFILKEFVDHVKSCHGENEEAIVKKKTCSKLRKARYFNCTYTDCTKWFLNEDKAKKHHDDHVRGYAILEKRKKHVENTDTNLVHSPREGNILFICEACNIATDSCDTVVEHSQNHIIDPNTKFQSVTCDQCKLSFEPECFKKHIVRHYKEKQFCKDSFTIHTYKYHLLFSDTWTAAFNIAVEEVIKLFAESIYAHTRSVKMMVIGPVNGTSSKVFNMYKCGQCNSFVEPASVANHTFNFKSCVKITKKFACPICARKFVSKLTRDIHQLEHNDGETIRIVAFNATSDREFNNVLNDPNIMSDILKNHAIQETDAENNTNISNAAVIYKCPCGLRFVSKEKSENHFRVCLKNDPIQNCPKCDGLFNLSELEDHLKQHMTGGYKFVYRDIISIEPIVIDSDDDSENDRTTSNNSSENKQNAIETETSQTVSNSDSSSVPDNSILHRDDEMDVQSKNVDVSTDEGTNNDDAAPLPSTATENEDVCMSESDNQTELEENHRDGERNIDDGSQDTIIYEELNVNTQDVFNTNEIKCVLTNLLLRPFTRSVSQTRRVSDEGRHIETIESVTVKQEILWKSSPTFDSHINGIPFLNNIDERIIDTVDLIDDEDNSNSSVIDRTEVFDVNKDRNNDSETPLTLNGDTPRENGDVGPKSTNGMPYNTLTAYYNAFNSSENTAIEE